jgi:hypothetical protein
MLTPPALMQENEIKPTSFAIPPAAILALLGAAVLGFQLYVLGRWVTGPYFVATQPGPDHISQLQHNYFLGLQIMVPAVAAWMLWHFLVKPWIAQGRITTDGRLIGAFSMIFFWDMGMNFSSTVLFYNSYFFNRGAWNLGSWPLWLSPDANALPEPIFVTMPGYTALVFSQILIVCWLLRKAKARFPRMGVVSSVAFIVLGLTILDSAIEVVLIRSGIYAYPGAIRSLSLFAGQTYQFPLTEGFSFGGLGVGATALLSYYRDKNGKTWAEAGIEQVNFFGAKGREWVRFFAVFGFIHGTFFALYTLPNQFLSLNSDPFPAHYPSYLENGMCVYGPQANQCPGPGVMMPRPPFPIVPGGIGRGGS